MAIDPQEFAAQLLGAEIVGEFGRRRRPVWHGPPGSNHAGKVDAESGRATGTSDGPANWASRPKVPMSEETVRKLAVIAEGMQTPQRKVSPMQVAAELL